MTQTSKGPAARVVRVAIERDYACCIEVATNSIESRDADIEVASAREHARRRGEL
jgi:hypothetical protein